MWCESRKPTGRDLEFINGVKPARFLEWLQEWDISLVRRDAIDKKVVKESDATRLINEYRRFLALSAGTKDVGIPASGRVDRFWHHHLLFTENYLDMCHKVFRRIIHHRPAILGEGKKPDLNRQQLDSMFHKEFGRKRVAEFW